METSGMATALLDFILCYCLIFLFPNIIFLKLLYSIFLV